jgi:hypothetical protein
VTPLDDARAAYAAARARFHQTMREGRYVPFLGAVPRYLLDAQRQLREAEMPRCGGPHACPDCGGREYGE